MDAIAEPRLRRADVAIVGTGVAGLAAALSAAPRRVLILTKSTFAEGGSSPLAQGGVAAAVSSLDRPELHQYDTIRAGGGLCDPTVVRTVTRQAPTAIRWLQSLGVRFDQNPDGTLALGREGAHGRDRIVHAADATGAELVRALAGCVREAEHVELEERFAVTDLLVEGGRAVGVIGVDRDGVPTTLAATAVVLATGGIGRAFRWTTNAAESTGDGLALAARAGARSANLEMVQFHPTALAVPGTRAPLLTEALRGEGAVLVTRNGRRFMPRVHRDAELAPRDVVARAIWRRRMDGDEVFLDARGIGAALPERFPTVVRQCRDHGFDMTREPVPVTPAAHYHMGGLVTDLDGRTSLPGLWACGEVAWTGLHGANRLASNSLAEAVVVGRRCGAAVSRTPAEVPPHTRFPVQPARPESSDREATRADGMVGRVRDILWSGAGVERSAAGLRRARQTLEELGGNRDGRLVELQTMLTVARLVLDAAEARTESRGAHFRTDTPCTSPCWRQNLIFEGTRLLPPQPLEEAAVAHGGG